ncbi:hypothetical protein K461DRAFT_268207 [Myriangium duriaei CBS 260.36]|uniref:N-acetyltransferase domain-containing protein n=1 Tax=Myriangium duriaei CBS 260.36 TaxID=1168546 RepID=A0A9P4J0N9_9PEZI|nr:hypothetical protein K461DRAFT_268207 [Myriangium duriaei CBS 260.36]
MAAFHLSRATAAEIPEMIPMIGRLADDDVNMRDFAIGPNTAESRERNTQVFQHIIVSDPHLVWMKVTEKSTGKIVGGSMWRIHQTVVPEVMFDNRPRPWLDDDPKNKQRVMDVLQESFEAKKRLCTQPHVRLGNIFTANEYRNRGAGSLMVKWGCDLADHLFLPIWVDATESGRSFYQKFGFNMKYAGLPSGELMMRDAKSQT